MGIIARDTHGSAKEHLSALNSPRLTVVRMEAVHAASHDNEHLARYLLMAGLLICPRAIFSSSLYRST
jgi:hypothetical protein